MIMKLVLNNKYYYIVSSVKVRHILFIFIIQSQDMNKCIGMNFLFPIVWKHDTSEPYSYCPFQHETIFYLRCINSF